jgi:hypothetical protein
MSPVVGSTAVTGGAGGGSGGGGGYVSIKILGGCVGAWVGGRIGAVAGGGAVVHLAALGAWLGVILVKGHIIKIFASGLHWMHSFLTYTFPRILNYITFI